SQYPSVHTYPGPGAYPTAPYLGAGGAYRTLYDEYPYPPPHPANSAPPITNAAPRSFPFMTASCYAKRARERPRCETELKLMLGRLHLAHRAPPAIQFAPNHTREAHRVERFCEKTLTIAAFLGITRHHHHAERRVAVLEHLRQLPSAHPRHHEV